MPSNAKMPKEKSSGRLSSGNKVVVITTVITALVGLIGALATTIIQENNQRIQAEGTETAWAKTVAAASDSCPPILFVPPPTLMPVLIQYVNVKEAGVHDSKDISSQPFQSLRFGDAVEVLDNSDLTWTCVTYLKGDVRIHGFVLSAQLINKFELTETALP